MKKTILCSTLTILGAYHISFAQIKASRVGTKANTFIAQTEVQKKSNNYIKINNTTAYKLFAMGAGPLVKEGNYVRMHFVQLCGDSVLKSTYRDGNEPIINKMVKRNAPDDFSKATYKMRAGDSLVVRYNVDSVLKKNVTTQVQRYVNLSILQIHFESF
jgi:hypothetical protein